MALFLLTLSVGSSPQAWGTLNTELPCASRSRFIPTGVGNIHHQQVSRYILAVHPHRRGEHAISICLYRRRYGSSPQAWGTFALPSEPCSSNRFIPTGVGNIPLDTCKERADGVHPHRRGEHDRCYGKLVDSTGSSPQAWGTWERPNTPLLDCRFIPTGVGNMNGM